MQHTFVHRILTALASSATLFALSACERALEVVDTLDNAGTGSATPSDSESDAPAPSAPNAACPCASSTSLRALACEDGETRLLDDEVVQTTKDGSAVVFNRCSDEDLQCDVVRWDGKGAEVLSRGLLVDIDGTGDRVLVSDGFLRLIDRGGDTVIEMGTLAGSNLLNDAGDLTFGSAPLDHLERGEAIGRRNAQGEIEVLGEVRDASIARAYVNPTGSALVGFTLAEQLVDGAFNNFVYQPFRWGPDGWSLDFPGVPEGVTIWPESLSADGSVIAGRSLPDQSHFLWSEAGGYVDLGRASWGTETFISADGTVVLCSFLPGDLRGTAAFRWTAETGFIELGPSTSSVALALSEDGNVAVAHSWEPEVADGAAPEHTFIWDSERGSRTLVDALAERGVDTSGWEFGIPRALSGDGHVLIGRGSCGGAPTLYRVELSNRERPEPSVD